VVVAKAYPERQDKASVIDDQKPSIMAKQQTCRMKSEEGAFREWLRLSRQFRQRDGDTGDTGDSSVFRP
jgi:hypothetical protein